MRGVDHPEVTALSGMNQMEQVVENIRIAQRPKPTPSLKKKKYDCTSQKNEQKHSFPVQAGYCMPCPHGAIFCCFDALNTRYIDNWFVAFKKYVMCTTMKTVPSNASKCVRCRRCEKLCPQGIQIVSELDKVKKVLENIIYPVTKFFMKFGKF